MRWSWKLLPLAVRIERTRSHFVAGHDLDLLAYFRGGMPPATSAALPPDGDLALVRAALTFSISVALLALWFPLPE